MTHATTLERAGEVAEGLRFDLWPLLVLALTVALILLEDRFDSRPDAAPIGATEEAVEGSVDETGYSHGLGRDGETAGRTTPGRSDRRGPEPPADSPGPLSPLGEQLLRIREEIVASGEPLLSWEELDREVAERRGETA